MSDKYLIVGAGRSGICSAQLLSALGKDFVIFDGNADLDKAAVCEKIGVKNDIDFILGTATKEDLKEIGICVVSPGVSLETDIMQTVISAGIPVWSEIELAYLYDKGQVIGITGTNGKTTTTSLTYEIVKAYNEKTLLVGNIEIPYTGRVLDSAEGGATVAEISSFQLETMLTFKPKVSAILNITPDHLDRHKTMENYADVKMSIAKNQTEEDFCVLNYDDEVLRDFGSKCTSKVVFFSSREKLSDGLYYSDGKIFIARDGESELFVDTWEVNLVGVHNFENIMAAVGITMSFGVPVELIREVVKKFVAVEHRIEYVTTKNGVKYYNDSKGTNTDAAIKAIDAMPSETVLIAGGYDKKSEYDEWVSRFPGKVRKLVLIGQTRENIAAACEKIGFKDYVFADSLQEAVRICEESALEGDCCLLSPACASWGMFKNYQQRGDMFKALVRGE
ncbi:MAG: UDP-N-acetylmuramoyl-L-alanine--D-glutamate ligase [Clostridia bacterium]|nr:UDP-N-acetylmuramoyl-L-alanine--D-glutamate ligase [Oscillospiraceae bacterium]MBQ7005504.1 UDP-N-acetylmuramoyl-L-alanine--D-glutamate ligase [Clostridia bacterium]